MPLPLKPFQMIRHGQSTANAAHNFAGIIDVELTKQGEAEAGLAREIFKSQKNKPSIIIHSKLSRARQTAEIINVALNWDMIEHAHIHEQDFGEWEDQPVEIFLESYIARKPPTNGECFDTFDNRVKTALNDILKQHENPLIVCHGGVFRAFHSLYNQGRFFVENALPYVFTPTNENKEFPWNIDLIR